jgi:hypothetical protein
MRSNDRHLARLLVPSLLALSFACGDAGGDRPPTPPGGGGSGGAGGSASSAASTGQAGSGAAGGGVGSGGAAGAAGSGGAADCASLPLCDDFEGAAVGGPPDPARWSIVAPSCSGTGALAVDDAQAHGGSRSVKVTGKGGYCNHVFFANTAAIAAVGEVLYGRLFLRLEDPLGDGHTTLLAMKDTADGDKDLRLGGQNQVLMWNRESDDATLPVLSPAGTALSVKPPAGQWLCVEFRVDSANGFMETWVDGAEVAGLHLDGTPTNDVDQQWLNDPDWKPSLADVKLGWESYAGQDLTLWFDDVAFGSERIGCD